MVLIASNLLGHLLPNPLAPVLARVPWISSIALLIAFPLLVMVPVLLAAGGRAGWRARSVWPGTRLGLVVSFATAAIVMGAYVLGLALGQPQLLRIGFGWESLRDLVAVVATTTAAGTVLGCIGSVTGAGARSFFTPRSPGRA